MQSVCSSRVSLVVCPVLLVLVIRTVGSRVTYCYRRQGTQKSAGSRQIYRTQRVIREDTAFLSLQSMGMRVPPSIWYVGPTTLSLFPIRFGGVCCCARPFPPDAMLQRRGIYIFFIFLVLFFSFLVYFTIDFVLIFVFRSTLCVCSTFLFPPLSLSECFVLFYLGYVYNVCDRGRIPENQ